MKRFLTITALTAVMGTGAFAASQAEVNAITAYYPDANFSVLTDDQVSEMMAIAQSGAEDTEKAERIQAIAVTDTIDGTAAPTQAEINAITTFYPEADFTSLTDEQITEMMAIAQSGDDDTEKARRIEAIAETDNPSIETADRAVLTEYFPEWRGEEMTEADKDRIVALVNRGVDPESIRVQLLQDMEQAAPNLTPAEVAAVQQVVPDADLRVLTTEQVNHVRAALYGEDSEHEQREAIKDALGS